ncbi:MAG: beta-mannosidase [Anaerolineae bacterium]|nr:beta-mannosidase [Anaerolineae bacterium]
MTSVTLKQSLDELDRISFNPAPSPTQGDALPLTLQPGVAAHPQGTLMLSLDGEWEMAEAGDDASRLQGAWSDAIPAIVPGSVQTALLAAGKIPDPYVGHNDEIARAEGRKTWWLRRTFLRPDTENGSELVFGGVCDSCRVWLNGAELGSHKGMFGEFRFPVSDKLRKGENTLVVKLDPAPYRLGTNQPNDFFKDMNVGWLDSVVINNIFGWHYINLPTIGIWRSVTLQETPAVALENPFVATVDANAGIARLRVTLKGASAPTGRLTGTLTPENFEGDVLHFTAQVQGADSLLYEFTIPDARAWYPVDHGAPNLYRLALAFEPDAGASDYKEITFGLRTIEMRPLPAGPDPELYNWTFVINGKPMFIKGANWCTMDALLRFDRERYDRFLSLARDSHIQLLRAWGSGMPETDDFFDLADRYGIMVMQEWPTAWNSHEIQPYDLLEETVRYNTLRLRNHPSLVMWGGGNESDKPFGEAIDMMGRYSYELDGTRPFHRGEPWGGSIHNYDVYWGRQPLQRNLSLKSAFIGEFGMASLPNIETVKRYLPENEWDAWPPAIDSAFLHRLPVFNLKGDMAIMSSYVPDWVPNTSLENFIFGMQMAQSTAIRHTLELARTRYPEATGAVYYKLNDNNPAAAWSSVDWYGVPKLAYHILRQAFRPQHACILFPRLSMVCEAAALPVFLLDDNDLLRNAGAWQVVARAFNNQLDEVARAEFAGSGAIVQVRKLGEFTLTAEQTNSSPLLIVCELRVDGRQVDRTFYWLNYTAVQGSLLSLPRTTLKTEAISDSALRITNTGAKPAVAVQFACPEISHLFTAQDSVLWLDVGESRTIEVNRTDGVGVTAWNA